MSDPSSTRERILEASRKLFNEKGYAATRVSEIAAAAGIATGNLTYHFPTKRELATELEKRARKRWRNARAAVGSGSIADDYVETMRFGMMNSWENRFLFRDHAQFRDSQRARLPDRDMVTDVEMIHEQLQRMQKEGMIRRDLQLDLSVLARSLFVITRFWMDHLREVDGVEEVSWTDQERGLQQHLSILVPCLTARARREFESALMRLAGALAIAGETTSEAPRPSSRDIGGSIP